MTNAQNSFQISHIFNNQTDVYKHFNKISRGDGPLRALLKYIFESHRSAYQSKNYGIIDEQGLWTRITYKDVMEICGCGRSRAYEALKKAKDLGIIIIDRFKQGYRHYKSGFLMRDNYLSFSFKKLAEILGFYDPEPAVDKVLITPLESLPGELSYNNDSLFLKLEYMVGDSPSVDNSNELPDNEEPSTTKIFEKQNFEKNSYYKPYKSFEYASKKSFKRYSWRLDQHELDERKDEIIRRWNDNHQEDMDLLHSPKKIDRCKLLRDGYKNLIKRFQPNSPITSG